jgi:hypothetical protein
MALYKYANFLMQTNSAVFDEEYSPGTATPHSGIYRCKGCGNEIAANIGNPLPPENHHVHSVLQGRIRWQLIVWA